MDRFMFWSLGITAVSAVFVVINIKSLVTKGHPNYFKLFNEYNDTKIKYEIIDLFDEQNIPAGTKVRILIPLNFSYKLKKHGKG